MTRIAVGLLLAVGMGACLGCGGDSASKGSTAVAAVSIRSAPPKPVPPPPGDPAPGAYVATPGATIGPGWTTGPIEPQTPAGQAPPTGPQPGGLPASKPPAFVPIQSAPGQFNPGDGAGRPTNPGGGPGSPIQATPSGPGAAVAPGGNAGPGPGAARNPFEPPPVVQPLAPGTPAANLETATVGVGAQGKGYGGGLYATPIATYFAAKESIVFTIQLPKAMSDFKAFNGRLPKSNDEFMREIIKNYSIPLPELPPDKRYVYDPERGELMVETVKK